MNEKQHIKRFQLVVIISSSLLILLIVISWVMSGAGQEYQRIQREYLSIWSEISDSIHRSTLTIRTKGIHQYEIEELKRVDRCITCHLGIDNPFINDVKQPFASHPGTFLSDHPVDEYGCTVCHGGQGRALNSREAHGIDIETHWDHPLLSQPYIQSSCGQCHLSVFTKNEEFIGTEVFRHGHEIFQQEGCLGCHRARGVGGIVGPDLTEQGEKTRHEYSFQNIRTEQTISNWLKEHFRDPEMVSPGSHMLKVDLPEKELDALTTFVLGMAKPDIAFEYFSLETLTEFKGTRSLLEGKTAYSMICSGCHGKDGAGKDYVEYKTGVPGILLNDFVRVASKDYIEFTLLKGRSRRQMSSWATNISGLTESEISELTLFIKTGANDTLVTFNKSLFNKANANNGKNLFAENCAACHGVEGIGGTALALNRRDLLRNADDEYIYKTLVIGRENATMPSWPNLSPIEKYDIIRFLRSFQPYLPTTRTVNFSQVNPDDGKLAYRFMCSRCHGIAGQGQTGPAIINKGFLEVATDQFLYNTISTGREHTAMFGWSTDVYNAERLDLSGIGNIISYIREESVKRPEYIPAGANPGDINAGRPLFMKHCAECHGEEGEGTSGPSLNNQELLSAASNGYLMASITIGREGTEMPKWGTDAIDRPMLTGKQRQDIVAFIRGWERIRIGY